MTHDCFLLAYSLSILYLPYTHKNELLLPACKVSDMRRPPFILALLIGFLSFFLSACTVPSEQNPTPDSEQVLGNTVEEIQPSSIEVTREFMATEDGQTALALTELNAEVSTQVYEFGTMVQGIDGVMADATRYWALYINGEYALVAADQAKLNKDDVIQWKLEAIQKTP